MSEVAQTPTRFEPPTSEVSEPFWNATREQRLVIQHCDDCAKPVWFPRHACPHCHASGLSWKEVSGDGEVYAVSVQFRAATPGLADRVPYAVVLVDLDIGIRLMSNVVNTDATTVTVGQRVRATWEPLTDGRNLLVFEPAEHEGTTS